MLSKSDYFYKLQTPKKELERIFATITKKKHARSNHCVDTHFDNFSNFTSKLSLIYNLITFILTRVVMLVGKAVLQLLHFVVQFVNVVCRSSVAVRKQVFGCVQSFQDFLLVDGCKLL